MDNCPECDWPIEIDKNYNGQSLSFCSNPNCYHYFNCIDELDDYTEFETPDNPDI